MGVPLYTTPTFTLTFSEQGLDLTQAQNVYVTFRSDGCVITKTGEDITVAEKTVSVLLSQEETSRFSDVVCIQVNWMASGKRIASEIEKYNMTGQLLTKVIP